MRLVPGIGTTSEPLRQHPGQRHLAGRAPWASAMSRTTSTDARLASNASSCEAGVAAAHVALGEVVERGDPAGEQAAAERAERHDADAELAAGRHDLVLDVAAPQRPLALQRGDRVDGGGAADRVDRRLRQPEVADLARGDQLGHRPDGLLDRARPGRRGAGSRGRCGRCRAGSASPRSTSARTPGVPSTTAGWPGRGRRRRCRTWWRSTTSSRRPAIALPTAMLAGVRAVDVGGVEQGARRGRWRAGSPRSGRRPRSRRRRG